MPFYFLKSCLLSPQTTCTSANIHLESGTCMVWKGTELPYLPGYHYLKLSHAQKNNQQKTHKIKIFKAPNSYLHFKLINNWMKFKDILGQMVQTISYWV